MLSEHLSIAVEELIAVRLGSAAIDQLSVEHRPATVDDSYDLQMILNRELVSALGPPVGYKIGCTTKVMQEYLKILHPCSGRIFSSTLHRNDGIYTASKLCRPGVECEIAVQLKADMPAGQTYTADGCADFVDCVFPSIELVDDRWTDYQSVDVNSLIAENFFGAGCVLGHAHEGNEKPNFASLAETNGRLWVNDKLIGTGRGADILGHPYEALAWLANHQIARGETLTAGDIVSLGSVVQTYWLNVGDQVTIDFDVLGSCTLTLVD